MSTEDRRKAKATAKNIEGKLQEAVGEVTGDPRQKAEGRAKQREAAAEHTVENLKDDIRKDDIREDVDPSYRDRSYPDRSY